MQLAVDYIKEKIGDFKPEIGIILGSGLGDFADSFESIVVPYNEIPGFQKSNVHGHKGQLVFAEVNGKKVVMMQGRYHFYEGHNMQVVTYPVKVMKKLGIELLIITNAAGAVSGEYTPGELMFITDHINFMGTNPLIGANDDSLGTRFPDMSEVYSPALVEKAKKVAQKHGIDTQEGVYMAFTGPSYETPAEVKMARVLGADAVGMSTVPEAIAARHGGQTTLGISLITNRAAGLGNGELNHAEVVDIANKAENNLVTLVKGVITQW